MAESKIRQILMIAVLVLMIPLFIKLIIFSANIGQNSQADSIVAAELIADAATPWWLGIVIFLSSLGTFGAIVIIAFFILLSKNKDFM